LRFAVNSILFQRGIYPADEFGRVKKYGMTLLISQQESVKAFIEKITTQIATWLETGNLQRVVLVIASISSKEVLERWNFNIENDREVLEKGYDGWHPNFYVSLNSLSVLESLYLLAMDF